MKALPFPVLGQALPIELANTRYFRGGALRDGLGSVADARAFVRAHALGVAGASVDEPARAALVEMRGLVREVLQAVVEGRRPASAVLDALNAAAARRPCRLELGWTSHGPRARRRPVERLDAAVSLAAELAEATIGFVDGEEAQRLRACPAPGCIGFFVQQHPRQEWCSVACGNRARNARFHERRRHGRDTVGR